MSESRKTHRFRQVGRLARAGAFVIGAAALATPFTARASLSAAVRPAEKLMSENRYEDARKLLELEARRGNLFANLELGRLYETGQGIPAQPNVALQHYKKAGLPNPVRAKHKAGLPEAQFRVAQMLTAGTGTAPDPKTAMKWLRWAANGGHAEAQLALAEASLKGDGTRRNVADALFWATIAEQRGADDAAIEKVKSGALAALQPEQIARLERRVADWEPNDS
jgi:TPR repeat protein